jgi:benzodiazapine receptor
MHKENKNYLSLIIWIVGLIAIGSIIGSFTKPEISNWYSNLNRASLTPPNYVFPIAWTILYGAIGACGWLLWNSPKVGNLEPIKNLYIAQLILNWSWTPLFFNYHLTAISLLVLILMDIIVGMIICLAHPKMKSVSILMIPYLLWILFASYLNFYIWQYN